MKDILILIYFIIFYIISIANMLVIIYVFKQLKKQNEQSSATKNKRIHTKIKTSNYNNSFGNRAYDKYKNRDGLYEPQKPHPGIELKTQKEE